MRRNADGARFSEWLALNRRVGQKHLAILADTADTADLEIVEVFRSSLPRGALERGKSGVLRTRVAYCGPEITTETISGDGDLGDLGGVAPRSHVCQKQLADMADLAEKENTDVCRRSPQGETGDRAMLSC